MGKIVPEKFGTEAEAEHENAAHQNHLVTRHI